MASRDATPAERESFQQLLEIPKVNYFLRKDRNTTERFCKTVRKKVV